MIKKTIGILSLILIFFLGGCTMFQGESEKRLEAEDALTNEERKEQLINYIEEKYDEEFEYDTIEYDSFYHVGTSLHFYPKGGNRYYYSIASRYVNEDGTIEYDDNYVSALMKSKYKKIIQPIVDKYFLENRTHIGIPGDIPSEFNEDTRFETFKEYADENLRISIGLFIPVLDTEDKNIMEDKFHELCEELSEIISIGHVGLTAYRENDYQEDVVNDVLGTQEKNQGYPTRNEIFGLKTRWGEL